MRQTNLLTQRRVTIFDDSRVKAFLRILVRLRILWIILLASLLMSGCVRYEAGINVSGSHRGEIVQHIKLAEQLAAFNSGTAQQWLNDIERRTRSVQGKTRRLSNQELVITIPFTNGADLEKKFNQFFRVDTKADAKAAEAGPDLPNLNSKLRLYQSNLLLLQRDRLVYDIDLRPLGLSAGNGNILVSPGALLELEFSLNTPWGARSINSQNSNQPTVHQQEQQLTWTLRPGELNHLEAVFWLPEPLGIGTVIIVLLVAGGYYVKYHLSPEATKPETGFSKG